jgi:ubiquinone/menaquinone biosynthesis C-methylase UbiE
VSRTIDSDAIEEVAATFAGFDFDFFRRVWGAGIEIYERRIRALGFTDKEHVLDCGFGMAQWLVALGDANARVTGLEYEQSRVDAARLLLARLDITNVSVGQGSIEAMPYADASFDAVFCYGVLFLADVRKGLRELHRVLKPGGTLYFTANGIGWFLHLIVNEHNKTAHYDPRAIGARAFESSVRYYATGEATPGAQLAVPSEVMRRHLTELGFASIEIAPEAGLARAVDPTIASFYPTAEHFGHENVYEVRCTR